ncbi:MAG: ferrous iron transport protein B, partial [Promethearchaeati archaeon]
EQQESKDPRYEEEINPRVILADERYELISDILNEVYQPGEQKWMLSDMLDEVFLHKYLGLPIFFLIMWAMFEFTFQASEVFMALIEVGFAYLGGFTSQIPITWVASLVTDGIIGGVGFILVFLPPILFMYFAIALLENSGYLARAAFVMDRLMVKMGLHGKSFIPLLLGFGCTVPAVMATRTIEGKSNRLTTILISPLMSCAARLPVYVLVAGVFFPMISGTIVFSMYTIGIAMAVVMALIFKKTLFQGKASPLLMELPMYQMPTLRDTSIQTWERTVLFLKKAGTYLLTGSVVLWFASSFGPAGFGIPTTESYVSILGKFAEPIFRPLGFTWEIVAALIFGLLAKEVVVGFLGVIFAVQGEGAIAAALQAVMSPVSAFAFMIFVLIYTPCIATIGVIKKETGSTKWAAFSVLYQFLLAYALAFITVFIGGLFF